MELDQSMSIEHNSGETATSHHDSPLVAQCSMVPDNSVSNSHLANDQQYLETRRLELIRSKYQQSDLNENAQAIFINNRLQDNSTNKSYKPGQLLFLKWCFEKQIPQQHFTSVDLIVPKKNDTIAVSSSLSKLKLTWINAFVQSTRFNFSQRRPLCQATTLFINSLQPNKVISSRTLQKWISKLIRLFYTLLPRHWLFSQVYLRMILLLWVIGHLPLCLRITIAENIFQALISPKHSSPVKTILTKTKIPTIFSLMLQVSQPILLEFISTLELGI